MPKEGVEGIKRQQYDSLRRLIPLTTRLSKRIAGFRLRSMAEVERRRNPVFFFPINTQQPLDRKAHP